MPAEGTHLLVVVSEALPGRKLFDALERRRSAGLIRCTVVCPQSRPPKGMIFSDDTSAQAARNRLAVTLTMLAELGVECRGEVLGPDAYLAAMDGVRSYQPDEIVLYAARSGQSGALRRGLADRLRRESGLPVEHISSDMPAEHPGENTVAIIAGRFSGAELARILKHGASGRSGWLVLVCPTEGGDPQAVRAELDRAVDELRAAGIRAVGQTMPCSTLVSIENAINYYPAREIVVVGGSAGESRRLEEGITKRLGRYTALPIERMAE